MESGVEKRQSTFKKAHNSHYDLIVIGGGITGAGIALDAVTRGMSVLLLEKRDFASGTSSKSTKLIHGGLRYLKQLEIGLVKEVGKERAIVHNLAPHLTRSEKMLLPLIKDGSYGKILTSLGLMVYDFLAGVEEDDRRKMLSKEMTLKTEPFLDPKKLEGGSLYAEYRTDDARLTIEIMKTADRNGADVLNYAEVTEFTYSKEGQITGVQFEDSLSRVSYHAKADHVVNATGPWVDTLRKKDKSLSGKKLFPTLGIHIVVPHERLPLKQSAYFDEPSGRMLFAIPRDRVTYIGTTDTAYSGDLNEFTISLKDVEYLIKGVNNIFPNAQLTVADVESSWAGLRPLIEEEGKPSTEVSRKDEIFESESGLLSIAGGKLTGYRKMAERLVSRVVSREEKNGDDYKECQTEKVLISEHSFDDQKQVDSYMKEVAQELSEYKLSHWAYYLVSNYGMKAKDIIEGSKARNEADPEVRLALSELFMCIEIEYVITLLDFLERRTGRLYFYINSIEKIKLPVLEEMAKIFGWDSKRKQLEMESLYNAIYKSSHFA